MLQLGEFDNDIEVARQLHQDLNGEAADQVLQAQREHDAGDAQGFQLIPPIFNEPLAQPMRFPWQIPNQRQLIPQEIYRRPGSIWDFIDEKVMLQVMSKYVTHDAGNVAGPSHRQDLPQARAGDQVNLPAHRSSPEEYFIVDLRRYINIEAHADDWMLVDVVPNIKNIFDTIKHRFFRGVPRINTYKISWHEMQDQTSFVINRNENAVRRTEVHLNSMFKLSSRIRLISTLFHICIHIAVFETSYSLNRDVAEHDVNFLQIMESFNRALGLQIGTTHQTLAMQERQQDMFRCETRYHHHQFNGIVSAANLDLVEHAPHQQRCQGVFRKVFKAIRNLDNNEETCCIVHKRIAIPRADATDQAQTIGQNLQQRVPNDDLAGEDGLLNVDVNYIRRRPRVIVRQICGQHAYVDQCCFCRLEIEAGTFAQHLDVCLG